MLRQRLAITIAFSLALVAAGGCTKDETEKQRIRILATTDEHSHLLAVQPERDEWPLPSATTVRDGALKGGVARRATVIDREKADGVPTVLLSNGDFSQGTLSGVAFTKANFDVMLMRLLGYDAIALGNHEFDLSPAGLAASVAAAKNTGGAVPFVLTNALTTTGTALDAIYGDVGSGKDVVKGLVVDKGGIKVGVVSAMSPSAAYDVQYAAAPVTFSTASLTQPYPAYVPAAAASIAAILQPVVDSLRTGHGAQVVVLLFHGGLAATASNGDVNLVVPLLKGVDVVIAGHTHGTVDATTSIADADSRLVPVVQPGPYGNEVARIEFTIEDGRPALDSGRTAFLPVDDSLAPTANQEIRSALSSAISGIEASVLPGTLSLVTGGAIADNPVDVGDLYFYPLGHTTYDVTGAVLPRETNALNLDTDAMLAVTRGIDAALARPLTAVALQNAGSIRGDLVVGDTGTLGFSDVFRMVSLGADPFELTPGYPLIRSYISAMELRAAFEQTLQMAYLNNDYSLGEAGLTIAWQAQPSSSWCATPAACALGPGMITSFQVNGDASPIYTSTGGWTGTPVPALGGAGADALRRIPVVTTYLVAAFAGKMGVSLYANDTDTTPTTDLGALVVEWPVAGSPNVKDHQALARYVRGMCLANGGELPATYNAAVPIRVVCTGVGCP
jgi:5'-nucleotidase